MQCSSVYILLYCYIAYMHFSVSSAGLLFGWSSVYNYYYWYAVQCISCYAVQSTYCHAVQCNYNMQFGVYIAEQFSVYLFFFIEQFVLRMLASITVEGNQPYLILCPTHDSVLSLTPEYYLCMVRMRTERYTLFRTDPHQRLYIHRVFAHMACVVCYLRVCS